MNMHNLWFQIRTWHKKHWKKKKWGRQQRKGGEGKRGEKIENKAKEMNE